ncbi:MAG: CidA/LrgA family protein [Treponemataceae bacterium]|nr:MAG: CidA/LrgA family protein [Treponemataceae bacterium]
MKILSELLIILAFGFAGEALSLFIPVSVPASVCGLLLMLAALAVKLLKCSHIERTADYVSANMSVLFVPTSVYVLECYPRIKAVVIPLILITLVSMAVTFFASYVTVHIVRRLLERRASAEKKTA